MKYVKVQQQSELLPAQFQVRQQLRLMYILTPFGMSRSPCHDSPGKMATNS
jgi:hypothetical protein